MWFQSNCPKILLQHKPRAIHSPATDQPQSYWINGPHTLAGPCIWPALCLGKGGQIKGLCSASLCGPPALCLSTRVSTLGLKGQEGACNCTTAKTWSEEVCPVCGDQEAHCLFSIQPQNGNAGIFTPGGNICTPITKAARQLQRLPGLSICMYIRLE